MFRSLLDSGKRLKFPSDPPIFTADVTINKGGNCVSGSQSEGDYDHLLKSCPVPNGIQA
jgi:hypothetical protein